MVNAICDKMHKIEIQKSAQLLKRPAVTLICAGFNRKVFHACIYCAVMVMSHIELLESK